MKDMSTRFDVGISLPPAARTAAEDGASVDLAGYHSATGVVVTGAYTDGSHTLELQHSDDDVTWDPVPDNELTGQTEPVIDAAGDADSDFRVGYNGVKRYLRWSAPTVTGTTTGAIYTGVIVRSHARKRPV